MEGALPRANVVDDIKPNSTIEYGSALVDRLGTQVIDWRTRELGLNIVLFGLAEMQAKRVSKLGLLVQMIENKLFDEDLIEQLPPDKIMGLYKMTRESLDTSYKYVREVLQGLNWSQFEAQLLTVQSEGTDTISQDGQDISRIAREIIEKMQGDGSVIREQ